MKVEAIDPFDLSPIIRTKRKVVNNIRPIVSPIAKYNYKRASRVDFDLPQPKYLHLRRLGFTGEILNDGGVTIAYHFDHHSNVLRYSFSRCPIGVNYNKQKGRLVAGGRYVSKRQAHLVTWDPLAGDEANYLQFLIEEVKTDVSDLYDKHNQITFKG